MSPPFAPDAKHPPRRATPCAACPPARCTPPHSPFRLRSPPSPSPPPPPFAPPRTPRFLPPILPRRNSAFPLPALFFFPAVYSSFDRYPTSDPKAIILA